MNKRYYETLLLCKTHLSDEEKAQIESGMTELLKKAEGTLTKFDAWGKYRLAYPVQKNEHGYYILARYETAGPVTDFFADLENFFHVKCTDIVIRFVNKALTHAQYTSAYQKPESLDVRSSGGADDFARESKLEGGFARGGRRDRGERTERGERSERTVEVEA